MIRLTQLRKSYGRKVAVDDLSLEVRRGEVFGLLGPNGAGKSTTIHLMVGLLRPDSGRVEIEGLGDPRRPFVRRRIGLAPQSIALYDELNANENLQVFGRVQGLGGAALLQRVEWAVEFAGLQDARFQRVETYSGGMKRRLNLAASLVHDPALLLLDEPTVGVDPQSRNAVFERVERLRAEGLTVVYTTHYMEEAERLCDRIGIIDEGRLLAEGTRRELVAIVGGHDRVTLTATGDVKAAADALGGLERTNEVSTSEGGRIEIVAVDARTLLPELITTAAAAGATVSSVEVTEPDLEAVFLHLTGKALRD